MNWLPTSPAPRDLGHFWSLAVEEQFYTIWPAVVFFCSPRMVWRAAVGLLVFDLIFRLGLSLWLWDAVTPQWRDLVTFARADTLAVGALLACRQREGGVAMPTRAAMPTALLAGIGMVGLRLLEKRETMPLLIYNLKWPLLAVGVGAVLIVVLTQPRRASCNGDGSSGLAR